MWIGLEGAVGAISLTAGGGCEKRDGEERWAARTPPCARRHEPAGLAQLEARAGTPRCLRWEPRDQGGLAAARFTAWGVVTVRLLTSSYAAFRPSWGVAVQISSARPKFPVGYSIAAEIRALMPRGLLGLRGPKFERAYLERLDRIGVGELRAQFERIAREQGDPLVLCCFEPAGQPCHRRTFANWWYQHTGEPVPEIHPVQRTLDTEADR
jgi:hypothetical protein